MQTNTKLPEGLTGISRLMGMEREEVMAWPFYSEVVDCFKDYNLKYLSKLSLIEKISKISEQCKGTEFEYFSEGIERTIRTIKRVY